MVSESRESQESPSERLMIRGLDEFEYHIESIPINAGDEESGYMWVFPAYRTGSPKGDHPDAFLKCAKIGSDKSLVETEGTILRVGAATEKYFPQVHMPHLLSWGTADVPMNLDGRTLRRTTDYILVSRAPVDESYIGLVNNHFAEAVSYAQLEFSILQLAARRFGVHYKDHQDEIGREEDGTWFFDVSSEKMYILPFLTNNSLEFIRGLLVIERELADLHFEFDPKEFLYTHLRPLDINDYKISSLLSRREFLVRAQSHVTEESEKAAILTASTLKELQNYGVLKDLTPNMLQNSAAFGEIRVLLKNIQDFSLNFALGLNEYPVLCSLRQKKTKAPGSLLTNSESFALFARDVMSFSGNSVTERLTTIWRSFDQNGFTEFAFSEDEVAKKLDLVNSQMNDMAIRIIGVLEKQGYGVAGEIIPQEVLGLFLQKNKVTERTSPIPLYHIAQNNPIVALGNTVEALKLCQRHASAILDEAQMYHDSHAIRRSVQELLDAIGQFNKIGDPSVVGSEDEAISMFDLRLIGIGAQKAMRDLLILSMKFDGKYFSSREPGSIAAGIAKYSAKRYSLREESLKSFVHVRLTPLLMKYLKIDNYKANKVLDRLALAPLGDVDHVKDELIRLVRDGSLRKLQNSDYEIVKSWFDLVNALRWRTLEKSDDPLDQLTAIERSERTIDTLMNSLFDAMQNNASMIMDRQSTIK